jgi:hypothetical protein
MQLPPSTTRCTCEQNQRECKCKRISLDPKPTQTEWMILAGVFKQDLPYSLSNHKTSWENFQIAEDLILRFRSESLGHWKCTRCFDTGKCLWFGARCCGLTDCSDIGGAVHSLCRCRGGEFIKW